MTILPLWGKIFSLSAIEETMSKKPSKVPYKAYKTIKKKRIEYEEKEQITQLSNSVLRI